MRVCSPKARSYRSLFLCGLYWFHGSMWTRARMSPGESRPGRPAVGAASWSTPTASASMRTPRKNSGNIVVPLITHTARLYPC
ncbi:hypothetical protein [Pandoravirus japonicus]|uniref:Uncharacterized protein n=1 Tax=Pandoravirus japonicus TaxID=2823154 RepID=A0A811BM89_9VIRU|nr:hypothetical protein [Pandoravirus japonicus]